MKYELKLKPCPLCGEEPIIAEYVVLTKDGAFKFAYCVYCEKCETSNNILFEEKNEAISDWNNTYVPLFSPRFPDQNNEES